MNSKFSALPDDIQEILDAERNAPDPALQAQGRVADMLSATLGIPLLVPGLMDLAGPSSLDPSGLDPSGLDPSGLDPSGLDPSGLDPSGLDPSSLDLSGLDPTLLDPSLLAAGAKAVGLASASKGAAGAGGATLAAGATTTTAAATTTAATTTIAAGAASTSTAGAVASGGLFALLAKPVVIGVFVAGSVLAGNSVYQEQRAEKAPEQTVKTAVQSAPAALEKPKEEIEVATIVVDAPKKKTKHISKKKTKRVEKKVASLAPKLAPEQRLKEEQQLLWQAKSKLHDGDAAAAIALLKKHQRTFSKGQLAEERDALKVLALARHDDEDKAKKAGEAFKKRYPQSMLLPTVEQAMR